MTCENNLEIDIEAARVLVLGVRCCGPKNAVFLALLKRWLDREKAIPIRSKDFSKE